MITPPPARILGCLAALLLTSCDAPRITTYTAPREPERASETHPAPMPAMNMTVLPGMAEEAATFDTPTWAPPADWQALPLGSIRKGSWQLRREGLGAEVAVFVFPGDTGGPLANVNRWREALGLGPLTQEAFEREVLRLPVDGHEALLVSFGHAGKHTEGVILPLADRSWFFRMTGDAALVEQRSEEFRAFVQGIRLP